MDENSMDMKTVEEKVKQIEFGGTRYTITEMENG